MQPSDKPNPRDARGTELYRRGDFDSAGPQSSSPSGRLKAALRRLCRGMTHRANGMRALRQGQFQAAQRHLRLALHGAPPGAAGRPELTAPCESPAMDSPGRPSLQLAKNLWRTSRRAEAYMVLHQALRQHEGLAELHMQLGLFHAAEGHFDQARSHLSKAAVADCTNPQAHYYLGLAAAAQADPVAAARSFQRAFLLRPRDLVLAYQLSLAAEAARRQGKCVRIRLPESLMAPVCSEAQRLADYIAAEPDLVDAFVSLPPDPDDAQALPALAEVVLAAARSHPARADLQLRCAQVRHRLGQVDQAIRHARQAVKINPRYVQALVQLGRLYAQADRPAQAARAVQRAIAAGGDWPDVHLLAAELMKRCRKLQPAAEHLKRALQLNPNYEQAARELSALAA